MADQTVDDTANADDCSGSGSVSNYVSYERQNLSTGQLVGGAFALFGTLFVLLGFMCWGISHHRRRTRREQLSAEKAERRRVVRERESSWVARDGTVRWEREWERKWVSPPQAGQQGLDPTDGRGAPPLPSQSQRQHQHQPAGPTMAYAPEAPEPLVVPYLGMPRPSMATGTGRSADPGPGGEMTETGLDDKLAMRRQAEGRSGSGSSAGSQDPGVGRTLLGGSISGQPRFAPPRPPLPPEPPLSVPDPSHYIDKSLDRRITRPLNIRKPTGPLGHSVAQHQTSLPSYAESQRLSVSHPARRDAEHPARVEAGREQATPRRMGMGMPSPPRSESLNERAQDVPREVDSETEDEQVVVQVARQVRVGQPGEALWAARGVLRAGARSAGAPLGDLGPERRGAIARGGLI